MVLAGAWGSNNSKVLQGDPLQHRGMQEPVPQVSSEAAGQGRDWSIISNQLSTKQEQEAEMENTLRL